MSETRFLGTWDELAVDFFTLASILNSCFYMNLFLQVQYDLTQITCTGAFPSGVISFMVTFRGLGNSCVRRQIDVAYLLRTMRDNLGPFLIFFLLIM